MNKNTNYIPKGYKNINLLNHYFYFKIKAQNQL